MFQTGTATDWIDLLDQLNTFLTATGSAFNQSYAGTGNGKLTAYSGGSASVAETFSIVAINSTTFSVTGSISGALSNATVGTPYTGTKIQFLISAGGTAFVATDTFTISTAPKWVQQRSNRALTVNGSFLEPWLAFNYRKDTQDTIDSNSGSLPATLGCKLASADYVYYVAIAPGANGNTYAPTAFDLQYSDNGSSWFTQQSYSSLTSGWSAGIDRVFTVTSPSSHQWWRINVTASAYSPCRVGRLKFQNASGTISHLDSIWKAPGNDGAQSIYVGVQLFAHIAADYYNWAMGGFTAYADHALFTSQAGACSSAFMPLWTSSIPYWFIADGSRVKVITKVSTNYESLYLGLIDPYFSPGQYPLPLAVGGSSAWASAQAYNSGNWRFSYTADNGRHTFTRGANNPGSGQDLAANLRLRKQDGTWHGFTAIGSCNSYVRSIYPSFDVMTDLRPNLDGSLALIPYILNQQSPAGGMGEIHGVYAVSGYSNGSENIVTINGVDHLVVQDVNRTTTQSYSAFALN